MHCNNNVLRHSIFEAQVAPKLFFVSKFKLLYRNYEKMNQEIKKNQIK
jgi:hypothetical protein